MLRLIKTDCGTPFIQFVPDSLNLLDLTTANAIAVEAEADIVVLSVTMTAGPATKEGVETIFDESMSEMVFETWADFIYYLNTTFKVLHGLEGVFNIAAAGFINYQDYEGFLSGVVNADYGLFNKEFSDLFN